MGGMRISKEIINARIADRGLLMIGEYLGNKIKTEFQCSNGHTWKVTPASIMRGISCSHCYGNKLLSKELINERLIDSGITMIDEYINSRTKITFQCANSHQWLSRPDSIMGGKGCPVCAGKSPLSNEIINERLSDSDRGLYMTGDYKNFHSKTEFQCDNCNMVWKATPANILCGTGCPLCCKYGFQLDTPGWLYILIFNGFIKYGITNNLDRRLKEHLKNGQYTIALTKLYEDGNIAYNWEKSIKIIFGGRFVSKEIMPDGYTETLSPDKLQALLDSVR